MTSCSCNGFILTHIRMLKSNMFCFSLFQGMQVYLKSVNRKACIYLAMTDDFKPQGHRLFASEVEMTLKNIFFVIGLNDDTFIDVNLKAKVIKGDINIFERGGVIIYQGSSTCLLRGRCSLKN